MLIWSDASCRQIYLNVSAHAFVEKIRGDLELCHHLDGAVYNGRPGDFMELGSLSMQSSAGWACSSSRGSSCCDACKANIINCGYSVDVDVDEDKFAAIIRRTEDDNLVVISICIGSNLGSCLVIDRFDMN